jgi:hypothetical protein
MGTETHMAKAYWVATYKSVSNPDALAEYAKLAGPAIAAGGMGRGPVEGGRRRPLPRPRQCSKGL